MEKGWRGMQTAACARAHVLGPETRQAPSSRSGSANSQHKGVIMSRPAGHFWAGARSERFAPSSHDNRPTTRTAYRQDDVPGAMRPRTSAAVEAQLRCNARRNKMKLGVSSSVVSRASTSTGSVPRRRSTAGPTFRGSEQIRVTLPAPRTAGVGGARMRWQPVRLRH